MLSATARIRVRYAETDQMSVAYHGNYLPWFEVARTQCLREHGLPYRDLEAQGYLLPVLEVQARYLRPARYDDELDVVAEIRERPSVRIRIDYLVRRESELLATGYTLHAFIDKQGRPCRPPSSFALAIERIFAGPG
jgi:acyl-CoA thioester hydrolase